MSLQAQVRLPRELVHRGHLAAAALYFDPALIGEPAAKARILSAWTTGARVYRMAGGMLLKLERPRWVEARSAEGLPLQAHGEVLYGVPLPEAARAVLGAPRGAVVMARAGRLEVHVPAATDEVDVASWIDLSAFAPVEVASLGAPPTAPTLAAAPLEGPLRARFGPTLAEPSDEAREFLARLESRSAPASGRETYGARGPGVLARLGAWLAEALRPSAAGKGSGATTALARSGASAGPLARAWERVADRLHRLLLRALVTSGIGQVLGARQGEYVRKMMELFERGDLEQALRHAIPLGGETGDRLRVALGVPSARSSLELQLGGAGPSSVMLAGPDLFGELQRRYRMAFEQLVRQGKIQEAAFVLAELLHANQEAVSFLESHGKLRLAAELAEARELPPGVVIRQWFRARDVARAVAVARRTGAFADGIAALERTHREEAQTLRLLWAELLAEGGDYERAVDVAWPVERARPLAATWLERALEGGGPVAARLLARRIALSPHLEADNRARVERLLAATETAAAAERISFGHALLALPHPDGSNHPAFARPVVRALLRDSARGTAPSTLELVRRLSVLGGDAALREDLPSGLPRSTPLAERTLPLHVVVPASAKGSLPIEDVVSLPRGRMLLALGEAGVRLVASDGRTLRHFDCPAWTLVPSVHRNRAIAVAPRGEQWRLSRVDLDSGRAQHWCDARLSSFAPSYDGTSWFVAEGTSVMELDALAPGLRALWRVDRVCPELGAIERLAVSAEWLSFLVHSGRHSERWRYQLPGRTLRDRQPPRSVFDHPVIGASLPGGRSAELACVEVAPGESMWQLAVEGRITTRPEMVRALAVHLSEQWVVTAGTTATGASAVIEDVSSRLLRASITFEDAQGFVVRLFEDRIIAADLAGRLVWISLEDGESRTVIF